MSSPQPARDQAVPAPAASARRRLAAAAIVLAGFCLLGILYALVMRDKRPGLEGDYIGYWAAGQQLIHHANPFDFNDLERLETAAGYDRVAPSVTPSPPPAYLLLLPLGLVDAWTGLILWGMAMVAALALSIWLVWRTHGHPNTLLYLFGFLFVPALISMLGGQIGVFFLLSVALFLYLEKRHPLLAGAALLPCTLKPHLFLPLAVALVVRIACRRAWAVAAGLAAALVVSSAVTLWFDPHIAAHYLASLREWNIQDRATPTFAVLLRQHLAPAAVWLEFLPAALACAWAAYFAWTRRARWQWMDHGLLVLQIAYLCAPYSWVTDESILLPAILTALARARAAGRSLGPFAVVAAISLMQMYAYADMKTTAYLWSGPAWLACWFYAAWPRRTPLPAGSAAR